MIWRRRLKIKRLIWQRRIRGAWCRYVVGHQWGHGPSLAFHNMGPERGCRVTYDWFCRRCGETRLQFRVIGRDALLQEIAEEVELDLTGRLSGWRVFVGEI